jgi:hypothetical protein
MERDSDRQKEMEGHRSTGQGSQRAVVPMEEEDDDLHCTQEFSVLFNLTFWHRSFTFKFQHSLCIKSEYRNQKKVAL